MTFWKIEVVRAAWGAGLLLAPRWVLQNIHHAEIDTTSVAVARVLGARQLIQATLSGVSPGPEILALGVWVDAVHSASMIALAGVDRTRARAALTDAAVAGAWALIGYRDLRTAHGAVPVADGTRDRLADWMLAHLPAGSLLRARLHRTSP